MTKKPQMMICPIGYDNCTNACKQRTYGHCFEHPLKGSCRIPDKVSGCPACILYVEPQPEKHCYLPEGYCPRRIKGLCTEHIKCNWQATLTEQMPLKVLLMDSKGTLRICTSDYVIDNTVDTAPIFNVPAEYDAAVRKAFAEECIKGLPTPELYPHIWADVSDYYKKILAHIRAMAEEGR